MAEPDSGLVHSESLPHVACGGGSGAQTMSQVARTLTLTKSTVKRWTAVDCRTGVTLEPFKARKVGDLLRDLVRV